MPMFVRLTYAKGKKHGQDAHSFLSQYLPLPRLCILAATGINFKCVKFHLLHCCVYQVVLPLALGQLARCTPMRKLHERRPKLISRLSECILLTVIYTTFCDTFGNAASKCRLVCFVGKMGRGCIYASLVTDVKISHPLVLQSFTGPQ